MKVLLIFPPQWTPFRPYLSLPSLTAYLREHNIDVTQKDFNIECYEAILSKEFLLKQQPKLQDRFTQLESRNQLAPGFEQSYYNDLFMANSSVRFTADKVEEAKQSLRDAENFYDVGTVSNARAVLDKALNIVSMAYYPTRIELESFEMPAFHGLLKEIDLLTLDKSQNPFVEICESMLLPFIVQQEPDVIGISIAGTSQLIPALTISRLAKSANPKIHVALGGHVITQLADSIIENKVLFNGFLDSAIIYEGERPLLKLIEHLRDGVGLDDIPNLIYFDGHQIRQNVLEQPEDVNSLPTPFFDDLPFNTYLSPVPVLPVLSARGCYWGKCAFCSQNLVYNDTYHPREVNKIVEDIKTLSMKHNVKHFAFVDEAIAPQMMNRLSDAIIDEGLDICCSTNIRFEKQFDRALCVKAKQAGFKLFYPGLESGCNRVLQLMEKGITAETASAVCRNIRDVGIWNHLYVMFGFPGETLEESQNTIEFLLGNRDFIKSFHAQHFGLGKGMKVQRHPENYGVRASGKNEPPFSIYYDFKVSPGISFDQAKGVTDTCMDKIATKFSGYQALTKLGHHYLLLYLSHFCGSDPELKAISQEQTLNSLSIRQLDGLSTPTLKSYVAIRRLRFNLLEIRNNISHHINKPACTTPCSIIFDPDRGRLKQIREEALEILTLCTGNQNVSETARSLSLSYDAPRSIIERDCLAILESMNQEGYLA